MELFSCELVCIDQDHETSVDATAGKMTPGPRAFYADVVYPSDDGRCRSDIGLFRARFSVGDAIMDIDPDHREMCMCFLLYARE